MKVIEVKNLTKTFKSKKKISGFKNKLKALFWAIAISYKTIHVLIQC